MRSDEPYQDFCWEHSSTARYELIDAPDYRWFLCTMQAHRDGGVLDTFRGWVETVLVGPGGGDLRVAKRLVMDVHRKKWMRHLDVLPVKHFFSLAVRPHLLEEPELRPFLRQMCASIVWTPVPIPLPRTCPSGDCSVELVKRLLLTFVLSFKEHSDEEQDRLLVYSEETAPDHSGCRGYVKAAN